MEMRALIAVLIMAGVCSACAYTTVKPVEYTNRKRNGHRFYDPKPILVATCDAATVVYVPDYSRGYTVQPRAWLAKNDSKTAMLAGMLTEQHSNIDTTGPLTMAQALGSEAIKAAETVGKLFGGAVGATGIGAPGIYEFEYSTELDEETSAPAGTLKGLRLLTPLGSCADGDDAGDGDDSGAARKERKKGGS